MNCALYPLLQLSSSFYVYQVLRKLPKGADKILVFMGYQPTSNEVQELKYEGDVNISRVLETAADLVILHSELDLIKELVGTAIHQSQSDTRVANFVTLHIILDARAHSNEKYDDTWKCLMKAAYSPPRDPRNQLSQPSNPQSDRPTSDITAYGNRQFLDAKQDGRRGSSPALNQWSDIQTAGLAQDLDLRRGSVPVLNSHPQSQFQKPSERLLEPAGRSHHSPSWGQVLQHAVPHQQYPSSGPHVLAALQSRDPSTASKLDPAIEHHDLHALHRQAALSGSAAVPQSTQQCQPLSGGSVGHHPNMPLGTATTSSGDCKHVQSTHQSQSPSSDSSSHYQNVQYDAQATSKIELVQSSRREDNGLYANISQTAVDGNQGAPTGQSPTAGHKQCLPQEAKVIHIRGTTPAKLHTSVSSRSFQENLRKLFQQFPDLAGSQEEGPAPSASDPTHQSNGGPSDPTYQNIGDVLQLEGEAQKPQESLVPDTFNFPEPVVQSEAELEQLERYRHNQSGLMSINTEIKDARSVIEDDGVGPCYDALSPPDRSLAHTPSAQDQQDINDAWTVRTETHIGAGDEGNTSSKPVSFGTDRRSPMISQGMTPPVSASDITLGLTDRLPSHSSSGTEDIYESASGAGSGGASLERDSSLPSPRNKPAETSGSASVEHETLPTAVTRQDVPRVVADCDEDMLPEPQPPKSSSPTLPHQDTIPEPDSKSKPVPKPRSRLQEMHTSKSLDNGVDEPKSPQPRPTPRMRGLVRNVKSASDLQQLGEQQHSGGHLLDVPTAHLETSDEDEGDNVTPGGIQPITFGTQTVQQDGVQQNRKPVCSPRQPSRGASTQTESVLSDNATSDGEGVNIQESVASGAVVGKESGETGLHLHKDGREHSTGHRPPTSPLQGKTLATVFESNAMADNPEQAPVKNRVTNESSLDFGGHRGQTSSKSHQKTSPSSRAYDMPSPQEMEVGKTELADPAVEGFWYCSYCTNLVSNTVHVCDICGCDIDAV